MQNVPVIIVEFVAVAVTLVDKTRAVAPRHGGIRGDDAGVSAKAQRAALVHLVALSGHEVDDLMLANRVEFAGIGVRQTGNIPGVLNDGDLHTKADAEIRHLLLPGVLRRKDHALNAPAAKAAGNDADAEAFALRTGASYIGVVGSRRKTKYVREKLEAQGFTGEQLDSVYAPIGIEIGSETPAEIAISIAAQLIQIRSAKTGKRKGAHPALHT